MSDEYLNIAFGGLILAIILTPILSIATLMYSRLFIQSNLTQEEKNTYRDKKSGYILWYFIGIFLLTHSPKIGPILYRYFLNENYALIAGIMPIIVLAIWNYRIGAHNSKLKKNIIDRRNEYHLIM